MKRATVTTATLGNLAWARNLGRRRPSLNQRLQSRFDGKERSKTRKERDTILAGWGSVGSCGGWFVSGSTRFLSVDLVALSGVFCWIRRRQPKNTESTHVFLMTATRIAGSPLWLPPAIRWHGHRFLRVLRCYPIWPFFLVLVSW